MTWMRHPLPLGLAIAAFTILLDQWSKWWLMTVLDLPHAPREVTSFFALVMVWNKGISFGMLSDTVWARWPLTVLALAIVAVLLRWLRRGPDLFIASAIGLVIGGALGNVIDRLRYGAVADFFYFHLGDYYWPAFNIADSAIFCGVAMLCWDSFFRKKTRPSS